MVEISYPSLEGECEKWHLLKPQPGITADEIAQLWSLLKFSVSKEIYEDLPDNLKRHFTP